MEQGKKSSTMAAAIPIPSNFGNVSNPVPADFLASPTSSPYTSPSTSPVVSSSFGSFTGASPFSMSPPLLSNPPAHFGNGLGLGVGQGLEGSNPALWYPCVVCSQRFPTPQPLLEHMGIFHHLIISDLHQIAELHTYLEYWHKKLSVEPLAQYATTINTRMTENGEADAQPYYLLSDILPEDKQLRTKLQTNRLNKMLELQTKERSEIFKRRCLFCNKMWYKRDDLFQHMFAEHHFNIGRPDNLVNIQELLDILQQKIDAIKCIYCEKTFKNHAVLKKHMRKKKHFKINSKDTAYDRFYMINYLEPGKDWKALEKEKDDDEDTASMGTMTSASESEVDETWDDWVEDVPNDTDCLFCDRVLSSPPICMDHMASEHGFDFRALKKEWSLDFYDSVKLVNYIRRQVEEKACVKCGEKQGSRKDLLDHMQKENHFAPTRDAEFWKNPQYLIPAKENDAFLQGLDDGLEDEDDDEDDDEMFQQQQHRRRFGEQSAVNDVMGKGKTKDEDEEKKLDAVVRDLSQQKLKDDESKFLDADE
jgi:hypothetical protein